MAWDWLMSIDVHWFSTLYGWYVFSGMWVGAMITSVIVVLYLKSKGYLPQVNNSHIQDMGKWMFAISFLWSYLWFSQFMLIWYANIPEEVTYFMARIDHYRVPFFLMFFINFALPMVILMSRDAKRNPKFLITIGALIFFGHWVDTYLLIIPGGVNFNGAHHAFGHIGFTEIGLMLGFLGAFIFAVFRTLTKAPLSPVNHPYLDESIHHQI
jgi:Ni/Fe-hydrogenase subunit HybB-like protein